MSSFWAQIQGKSHFERAATPQLYPASSCVIQSGALEHFVCLFLFSFFKQVQSLPERLVAKSPSPTEKVDRLGVVGAAATFYFCTPAPPTPTLSHAG